MKTNLVIFLSLCLLFLAFSAFIYTRPLYDNHPGNSALTGEGRLVWQKYNCQSCHQLYGLGGYLGPDLTNVISEKGKGNAYIIGMLSSGTKQMPAFSMTKAEEKSLLEFLREVNRSGKADPRNFSSDLIGMIREK